MDLSKMTEQEARAIVLQAQNVFDASISDQQRTSPKEIQSLPIDLSVARTRSNAMKVSFPFKSLLVEQATDINTYIYLIPISNDSGNDPIRLGLRDVYKSEFGFRECYIYWDAQAAKSVLLKFFVRSIIENGRLVLDQNSTPSELQVGYATSQNDGFTYVLEAAFISAPAGGAVNTIGAFQCVNNYSMNDVSNVVTVAFPFSRNFKVPAGFTAEIIGSEVEVRSALPNGVTCCVNALKNNSTHANALAAAQFGVSSFGDNFKTAVTLTQNYRYHPTCSANFYPFGSLNRVRNLFYENEIIFPIIYSIAGAGGACNGIFRIMVRLTKNVE